MSVEAISRPKTQPESGKRRLESWKEIATYLGRDVTTVRRWEKREGMPVHRHLHERMGSVYAFCSELDSWLQTRRLALEEGEKKGSSTGAPGAAERDPGPRGTLRARTWLVLAGMLVLAMLAAAYFITRNRASDAAHPKIKSLAVLPLKNLSGDSTQEYLADGMTEALIGRLSRIHDLRVISRTSVMRFKETRLSAPEIAKTLNVDAIFEGSIIREGSHVRVNAQLIRGATDEHFWSETYDRELRDALTLESEVAQSIARRVEVTVTGEERARLVAARPVSPEAYESYLKGQFAKSNTRADIEVSIAYFEEAIRKDATFAPAYVGLAGAYETLGTVMIGAPPDEVRPKVISATRKALELDPQLSEAHALLAETLVDEWRWPEAQAEYERAIELSPSDAAAHAAFADWFLRQGRTEEALSWARRAQELDPLALTGIQIGWILFHARRYDESIRELRTVLAIEPESPQALWFLGFALLGAEQNDEAVRVLERDAAASHRSSAVLGLLVRAYARAGRRAEALRVLDELQRRRKAGYVPAAAFLNAYLGLGDTEQAFIWMGRAAEERSNIMQFLKVHPFFDPLRGDPRFAAFLRQANLQ